MRHLGSCDQFQKGTEPCNRFWGAKQKKEKKAREHAGWQRGLGTTLPNSHELPRDRKITKKGEKLAESSTLKNGHTPIVTDSHEELVNGPSMGTGSTESSFHRTTQRLQGCGRLAVKKYL